MPVPEHERSVGGDVGDGGRPLRRHNVVDRGQCVRVLRPPEAGVGGAGVDVPRPRPADLVEDDVDDLSGAQPGVEGGGQAGVLEVCEPVEGGDVGCAVGAVWVDVEVVDAAPEQGVVRAGDGDVHGDRAARAEVVDDGRRAVFGAVDAVGVAQGERGVPDR